jgi:hypothetical protein
MLRWFPRLEVATACFSCSPPDLNFLDPNFTFMYMHNNHCHRATAHLQLNILLLLLLNLLSLSSVYPHVMVGSREGVVDIVTTLRTGRCVVRIPVGGVRDIYFIQIVQTKSGTTFGWESLLFSGVKRRSKGRSAAARLLRLWVRIPPGLWMSLCCECCVLSGRGLCNELINRPEESYGLCCVVVCDLEIS